MKTAKPISSMAASGERFLTSALSLADLPMLKLGHLVAEQNPRPRSWTLLARHLSSAGRR